MKKNIFLAVLALTVIVSCVGQKGDVVSPKEFQAKISSSTTILDVRSDAEFKTGHLSNALNMDVNGSQFEAQSAQLDKSKPVLVYCKAGVRSNRAAQILRKMGYNVIELNGGIDAWQSQGLPVVK